MSETNEASVQSVVRTPGPWEVREVDGLFAIAHRDGWVLDSNDEQQDRADAKLIAAAPDMFEVIKRFATVDWMGEAEINLWVKRCREIMRKVV
jgi:hypothetical protein